MSKGYVIPRNPLRKSHRFAASNSSLVLEWLVRLGTIASLALGIIGPLMTAPWMTLLLGLALILVPSAFALHRLRMAGSVRLYNYIGLNSTFWSLDEGHRQICLPIYTKAIDLLERAGSAPESISKPLVDQAKDRVALMQSIRDAAMASDNSDLECGRSYLGALTPAEDKAIAED